MREILGQSPDGRYRVNLTISQEEAYAWDDAAKRVHMKRTDFVRFCVNAAVALSAAGDMAARARAAYEKALRRRPL